MVKKTNRIVYVDQGQQPAFGSPGGGGGGIFIKGAHWDSGLGGAVTPAAASTVYISSQAAGTITSVTVLGGPNPGSATFEVWKRAAAVPTVADKISAATPVTMNSAQRMFDNTLAGWVSTAVVAGDVLAFKLLSCSGLSIVTITLEITP